MFFKDSPANEANINTRIVNGQRAPLGIFPWHALLQIERYGVNSIFYCGGAILNRNWVLTSADCLQDASRVRIDAGSVELRRPAVTVLADAFFTPRDYNPRDFANNLALLRIPLQSSLNFTYSPTANLAPIRLPALSQERETFVDQEAHFTGFGYTMKGNFYTFKLKHTTATRKLIIYLSNSYRPPGHERLPAVHQKTCDFESRMSVVLQQQCQSDPSDCCVRVQL